MKLQSFLDNTPTRTTPKSTFLKYKVTVASPNILKWAPTKSTPTSTFLKRALTRTTPTIGFLKHEITVPDLNIDFSKMGTYENLPECRLL